MAVFDEAPECLHPLPQYLGRHGVQVRHSTICAARARSCKSGSDDRLENSIFFHKPIYTCLLQTTDQNLPCRGTSTRCLINRSGSGTIWPQPKPQPQLHEDIYPLKHSPSAIDRPTMTSTTRRYSYRLELEAVGSYGFSMAGIATLQSSSITRMATWT
jgi:hypothetical protein